MIHKILFLLLFFTMCIKTGAQQQYVGVSLNANIEGNANLKPGFGILYENQFSKHHGFEIELNYRSRIEKTGILISNNFQLIDVQEFYLSMPVLYKFYSKIVNVSTGITFDYFVDWHNDTKQGNDVMTSYSIDPKLYLGWAFKVSKPITLSSKFVLEPEIHFNPIFNYGYIYYGAALQLKYKL